MTARHVGLLSIMMMLQLCNHSWPKSVSLPYLARLSTHSAGIRCDSAHKRGTDKRFLTSELSLQAISHVTLSHISILSTGYIARAAPQLPRRAWLRRPLWPAIGQRLRLHPARLQLRRDFVGALPRPFLVSFGQPPRCHAAVYRVGWAILADAGFSAALAAGLCAVCRE